MNENENCSDCFENCIDEFCIVDDSNRERAVNDDDDKKNWFLTRENDIINCVDAFWRRDDKEIRCEIAALNKNAISTKINASIIVNVFEKLIVDVLTFETWKNIAFKENAVMFLFAVLIRSRESNEFVETRLFSTSCCLLSVMMRDCLLALDFLENVNDKVWIESETTSEFSTYVWKKKRDCRDVERVANSNFWNIVDDDDTVVVKKCDSCRRFTWERAIFWEFVAWIEMSILMNFNKMTKNVNSVIFERVVLMKETDVFVLNSFINSLMSMLALLFALYLWMSALLAAFLFFAVWYLTERLIVTTMQ